VKSEQESIQQQPQSPICDAAVPAASGAEAVASPSESVAANLQPSSIAIIPPSGTVVPNGFVFVETTYEPNPYVSPQEVAALSDNALLTGLKKQRKRTQEELDAFVVFFDEALARFSDEQPRTAGGQFQRGDKPTLPEAFAAIGLNYETERKRKQRYLAAMRVRFPVAIGALDGSMEPSLSKNATDFSRSFAAYTFIHAASAARRASDAFPLACPNDPLMLTAEKSSTATSRI
jgi:hypothetical protein